MADSSDPSSPSKGPFDDSPEARARRLQEEGWTLIGADLGEAPPSDSERSVPPPDLVAAERAASELRREREPERDAVELGVTAPGPEADEDPFTQPLPVQGGEPAGEEGGLDPAPEDFPASEPETAVEPSGAAAVDESRQRSSAVLRRPRAKRSAIWTMALVGAGLAAVGGIGYAHFFGDARSDPEPGSEQPAEEVSDVDELRRRVDSLGVELAAAREQGRLAGERAREAEQRARASAALAERFPDLQRDALRLEEERVSLEGDLQTQGDLARELTSQRDELRRSVEALEGRVLEVTLAGREDAARVQEELSAARADLTSSETELERSEAAMTDLRSQVEEARSAETEARAELESQRRELSSRIAELELGAQALSAESEGLRADVGRLESDLELARELGAREASAGERVVELEEELRGTRASLVSVRAELQAERGRILVLEGSLAAAAVLETQLSDTKNDLDLAQGSLAAERDRGADLAQALEREREERERLENEREARLAAERALEEERARNSTLEGELEAERDQLARAEQEREVLSSELERVRAQPAPSDPWILAQERLLEVLEGERPGKARALWAELVREGVLRRDAADGGIYWNALCATAGALADAAEVQSRGAGPGARELFEAHARLDQAERSRDGLERTSSPLDGRTLGPELLTRADSIQAGLRGQVDAALADLDGLHAADWEWIEQAGRQQDPTRAFEHARDFACNHLDLLALEYAGALEAACGGPDGPQADELSNFAHLAAWGARIEELDPDARGQVLRSILEFDLARRWYVDGADPEAWLAAASFDDVTTRGDWRATLLVQAALAVEGAGWPPPRGRAAVFSISGESRARWRVDWLAEDPPQGAIVLLRAHYDARGRALGEPTRVRIERDGLRYRYEGAEDDLVNLRASSAEVEIVALPSLSQLRPPPQTGATPSDLSAFRARVAAGPDLCLVQRSGAFTRYFTPGLGLVREDLDVSPGNLRIDLVCWVDAP